VQSGLPECLHVYWSLEHKENVSVIVGVEFFAIRAKVLSTEGTAVPLPDNVKQVPVAKREGMGEVAQIS